jgi:hypothetical protein
MNPCSQLHNFPLKPPSHGCQIEIVDSTSWKLRRMSWIRNGKDIGLKISPTNSLILMIEIAG